jgi:hypothetical protein
MLVIVCYDVNTETRAGPPPASGQIGRHAQLQGARARPFQRAVSSPKRITRLNELRMKACERWPRFARPECA